MKIKTTMKTIVIALSLLFFVPASYAGGPSGQDPYYMGKGRIALSSDGNCHDNDDMQASMLSLAILAYSNLQNKTVLYTYADHVWGNEQNDLPIMKKAVLESGERFGFKKTKFIAAVDEPEAAYNAMCDAIIASTAKDPLFIIAAGPMHVIGMGLERAAKKNPESLKYVTVISHSTWNNAHADKPGRLATNKGIIQEPHHTGWTWAEMEAVFGDKVYFNKIVDQNQNRFKAIYWESWRWMSVHKDKNIRWMYDMARSHPIGGDFSDAGMLWYLCVNFDGVRGDENGNTEKLRKWMGGDSAPKYMSEYSSPLTLINGGDIVYGEEFIAIKGDATESALGEWKVRKAGTPEYTSIKGDATSGRFIEYTGGHINGSSTGKEVLEYKFIPKTSGEYRLTGRIAQRLTVDGVTAAGDLCNDVYVKMLGDYEVAKGGAPMDILKDWSKFYGRGYDSWGALTGADIHHKKFVLKYKLKEGVEYTMQIKGRSQRICVDYYILCKSDINPVETFDFLALNDSRYSAGFESVSDGGDFTAVYMSKDFDKFTNMGKGFVNATVDKWRKVLQIAQPLKTGAAEMVYQGPSGKYDLALNAILEEDGECTYKIFVNEEMVGEFENKMIYGTDIPNYTVQKHQAGKVSIKTGDKIRVEFTNDTNGKIPEGNSTATARARWQSIELSSL